MSNTVFRTLLAASLLALPTVTWGQEGSFRVPPTAQGTMPAAQTQGVTRALTSTPVQPFSFTPVPPVLPSAAAYGAPFFPYGGGFFPGVAGGYLMGMSDVISAQGQFAIQQQQAVGMFENTRAARLENRRRLLEEYLWERENMPTLQDDRERSFQQELRRSRFNPPATEIWSGKALNDLLANIQKTEAGNPGLRGPSVPLDPEMLRNIGVTAGTGAGGNVTMLQNGKVAWPLLLQREQFAQEREMIDRLVSEAFRQIGSGALDAGTLSSLNDAVSRLRSSLRSAVADLPPNEYINSLRFMNQLASSIAALQDPSYRAMLKGQLGAQGNTVAELVDHMSRQGLRFAPAAQGAERYYTALHQALMAYEVGLTRLVSK